MTKRLVVLAILDGWGLGKPGPGNAISLAHTPHLTRWFKAYPHTQLEASGLAVGLPEGIAGNSEVGHINLGAGYVVEQDAVRISRAITDGSFYTNPTLVAACRQARHGATLHFFTLLGPGQVHSSIDHLWAMLTLAQQQGVSDVAVHVFSDGRDSSPTWLAKNAAAVEARIRSAGAHVASVVGRYFAMDRNQRWERTEQAYRLLVERKGQHAADLEAAARNAYAKNMTDEFIEPTVVGNGKAVADGDVVVFLNYRTDRPRQLSEAFLMPGFVGFPRSDRLHRLQFYTMTDYEPSLPVSGVAFQPEPVVYPLARVLSESGLQQLHAAETEKYAHVTYFLNGGQEAPFAGEERLLVPSPKVATYDLAPAMSAHPLTEQVCQRLIAGQFDVVVINYANADMVGHSGSLDATIQAVEAVDACLGQLWQAVKARDGALLVTADHGNAECLAKLDGSVDTEHNLSPVPLLAIGENLPGHLQPGALASVTPTLLRLLGLTPPEMMTAPALWRSSP